MVTPEISVTAVCLCSLVDASIMGSDLVLEIEEAWYPGKAVLLAASVVFNFESHKYCNKNELELPDSYEPSVDFDMTLIPSRHPLLYVIYESVLYEAFSSKHSLLIKQSKLSYNQSIIDAMSNKISEAYSNGAE